MLGDVDVDCMNYELLETYVDLSGRAIAPVVNAAVTKKQMKRSEKDEGKKGEGKKGEGKKGKKGKKKKSKKSPQNEGIAVQSMVRRLCLTYSPLLPTVILLCNIDPLPSCVFTCGHRTFANLLFKPITVMPNHVQQAKAPSSVLNKFFETPVGEVACIHVGTDRAAAEARQSQIENLDLGRTPYVSYGVKYIGLVSLGVNYGPPISKSFITPLFFQDGLQAKPGFEMCFGPTPWVLGPKHVSNPE